MMYACNVKVKNLIHYHLHYSGIHCQLHGLHYLNIRAIYILVSTKINHQKFLPI